MPSTPISPADLPHALRALRRPIETFTPRRPGDEDFRSSMLGLARELEDLWSGDEAETLESDVVWTALYAFPALTATGPSPQELVELTVGGRLMDGETADLLRTVGRVRRVFSAYEPPGFAASLWRAVLLAVYGMIELFVVVDGDRGADRCFELLDTAEAIADRFSGAA